MVLGAGVAAVLLILFTGIVATLMQLPYLKFVGGLALFWVAIKLVTPQPHDAEDAPEAIEDLWRAVRVVVVANMVMSLDNVIAVAAAAKGNYLLLALGLAISIPMVIAGSALFLAHARALPDRGLGRRRAARLDRGRLAAGRSGRRRAASGGHGRQARHRYAGIAGAILVVSVGWYLVRSSRLREAESDV